MRNNVVAVVVVAFAAASSVHAAEPRAAEDNSAKAKKLYQAGSKAYAGERYKEALYAFTRANELDPHAAFWFNIGQCERMMGNAPSAIDAYQKYLDGSPGAPNRVEVEKFIADLKATVPATPPPPAVEPAATAPEPPPTVTPEDKPPWLIIGGVTAAAGVVAVAGLAVAVSILSQPTLGKVDLRGGA